MTQKFIYFLILASMLTNGGYLLGQETFTDRGIIFVRGGGNLEIVLGENSSSTLSAGAGYFFWNNLLIGGDLYYENFNKESDFRITPFARYYYRQRFFGELQWHPGSSGENRDSYFVGGVGYIFSLNDYITLEPSLYLPFVEDANASFRLFLSLYF